MDKSFIEVQFPVSKVSKESYKERKANNGQTLTGLGKWWGRKPLILVRAAILGSLMPASDNPQRDKEIFLKLLSMDSKGLEQRKEKKFAAKELYDIVCANRKLNKYKPYFDISSGKPKLDKDAPRDEIEMAAFNSLGYDAKIAMCKRPEHVEVADEQTWNEINHHLGTSAHSLQELVNQLSEKHYGHNVVVGDCFCGGGSIPFEAARIGCDTYASDLNPIASLLTWADLNICGASKAQSESIKQYLTKVYNAVEREIEQIGIERNELGDRALTYLYCIEARCPECGHVIPLAPSWVIGKGTKTVVQWHKDKESYSPKVIMNASEEDMKYASLGTITNRGMKCLCCGKTTSITSLRRDTIDRNGNVEYGLRKWNSNDFYPRDDDVYQERLYAIKYERTDGSKYYCAPSLRDIENEKTVYNITEKCFDTWQQNGYIPSMAIESGAETERLMRERGWTYWHQLFTCRQLFIHALFMKYITLFEGTLEQKAAALLGINKLADWDSKLCRWDSAPASEKVAETYFNQALNTIFNYPSRGLRSYRSVWYYNINNYPIKSNTVIRLCDARDIDCDCDYWITDPPYADAVNYHELSELFLSWDKKLLSDLFPDWYSDSKRILAVRGDEHFSQTMIDIYSNLTQHMPDNGMQIVMFTHSDPAVWAQLALIMWKAGLTVTAAWNIATETDASGLKDGNYVKGTVLLVLRKQQGDEEAFLDELTADIKSEVKNQIESMQKLDDKEDPNFSDPDYVLAAYAASLKVLTSYKAIGEIDLDYELSLAIHDPARSQVVKLIERAKKIAYDFIIPVDFDNHLWRELCPAERFYIKGLEAEKHGNYQVSTYQEYARGFGLTSYSQLMANEKANTARLKTPSEFAMRNISDVPGFEESILRIVLAAIHITIKEDENPQMGLWHLKNTVPNYWDRRDMLKQLLAYLAECKDIDTMPHWKQCGEMASHLYTLVDNDRI